MNSETLSRALIQSDCLYLQAAGSTGDDGSVPGIHLRWLPLLLFLLKEKVTKKFKTDLLS